MGKEQAGEQARYDCEWKYVRNGIRPVGALFVGQGLVEAVRRSLSRLREFTQARPKLTFVSVALVLSLTAVVLFVPWVFALKLGPVKVTQWDKAQGKVVVVVGPGEKTWVPLAKISRHVLNAVVVAEDARFYQHRGLDFGEIWKSFLTNLKRQRYARGGSTITQQLIKLVFLESEKTIIRKAREATGALLLELIMSKEQILEWYLNVVDFGNGVYGIKRGAAHYFSTNPELLSVVQAVHLAIVLPSPNRWSIGLRRGELTRFGHKRFAFVLTQMRRNGYITYHQWEQAMASGNFGSPLIGAPAPRVEPAAAEGTPAPI